MDVFISILTKYKHSVHYALANYCIYKKFYLKICSPLFTASSCPKLSMVEHGMMVPASCTHGKTYPGEQCVLHCQQGREPAKALGVLTCQENYQWFPNVTESQLLHACIKSMMIFNILKFLTYRSLC